MKRKLAVVLTAAMLASLAACGSPTGDTVVSNQENEAAATEASTGQTETTEVVSESEEEVTEESEKVEETEKAEETEKTKESQTEEAEKKESEKKESDKKESEKKESEKKETGKTTAVVNNSIKDTTKPIADQTEKPTTKPVADKTEKPTTKPATDKTEKPAAKPATDKTEKPAAKPDKNKKPSTKPNKPDNQEKPTNKPDKNEKPENTESGTNEEQKKGTVANTLLSSFKACAKSGNTEAVANTLIGNSIIPFAGAAMPVEEGMLTGFGDAEITGFKEGTMFGPVIGTIPFVGYVFELKDDTDVNQFISDLKGKAMLNWNICTSADEMMTGHVDKKVFFVMCPKYFE